MRFHCDHTQLVISWEMCLLDDIDITSSAVKQQLETMALDAFKEAILWVTGADTFVWCVGVKDVTIVLSTEARVWTTFDYDDDLENEVFSMDDTRYLKMTFGAKLSQLAQQEALISADDGITNLNIGDKKETNVPSDFMVTQYILPLDHETIASLCIVCIAVLLLLFGSLYSKCRCADDFQYVAVALFGIYAWDFFSDLLFAVDVWRTYLGSNPEKEIPNIVYSRYVTEIILSVIFGCSVAFIVLPLLKNFWDLIISQGLWQKHPMHADRYRSWLNQYGTFLFWLSFICGSTFGAVSLVNSNLFGKRLFSMGLSKYDLRRFNQKRLVNVIVGENLPQLVIQILYASVVEGGITMIAFAAIASSTLSVCAAVLDFASKKKLLSDDSVHQTLFSVKVVSTQRKFTRNIGAFKHKTLRLMAQIARMFPIDRQSIEILPIQRFSDHNHDGMVLSFVISTSKFEPEQVFQKLNVNNRSHLARQVAKAWGLNAKQIKVYDLDFMSKSQATGHFVEIQLNEHMNRTEVKAQEETDMNAIHDVVTNALLRPPVLCRGGVNGRNKMVSALCTDCQTVKQCKEYSYNGAFYCLDCWGNYEDNY